MTSTKTIPCYNYNIKNSYMCLSEFMVHNDRFTILQLSHKQGCHELLVVVVEVEEELRQV